MYAFTQKFPIALQWLIDLTNLMYQLFLLELFIVLVSVTLSWHVVNADSKYCSVMNSQACMEGDRLRQKVSLPETGSVHRRRSKRA